MVFRWPSTWCEHQTRSQSAGSEEALSATLAALGDIKESCVGLSQNSCHPCVNSFSFEAKTHGLTNANSIYSDQALMLTYLPLWHQSSGQPFHQSFQRYTCISPDPSPLQQRWSTAFQIFPILSAKAGLPPFLSILPSEWDYNMKQWHIMTHRITLGRAKAQQSPYATTFIIHYIQILYLNLHQIAHAHDISVLLNMSGLFFIKIHEFFSEKSTKCWTNKIPDWPDLIGTWSFLAYAPPLHSISRELVE